MAYLHTLRSSVNHPNLVYASLMRIVVSEGGIYIYICSSVNKCCCSCCGPGGVPPRFVLQQSVRLVARQGCLSHLKQGSSHKRGAQRFRKESWPKSLSSRQVLISYTFCIFLSCVLFKCSSDSMELSLGLCPVSALSCVSFNPMTWNSR